MREKITKRAIARILRAKLALEAELKNETWWLAMVEEKRFDLAIKIAGVERHILWEIRAALAAAAICGAALLQFAKMALP